MDTPSPLICSVVLTRNREQTVLDCLESLAQQTYPYHKIVVVDNCSDQEQAPIIHEKFPDVTVIRLETNLGFTGGMNRGMVWSLEQGADLALCLNDDLLFHPGCLEELANCLATRPKAGILCPWVYHPTEETLLYSAGVTVDKFGRTRHLLIDEPPPETPTEPYECQAVTGCAIGVTRELLYRTGGFDGRLFIYYEETDLCARAWEHNLQVWVVPKAGVIHLTMPSQQVDVPHIVYLIWRNRLFYLKNRRAGILPQAVTCLEALRTAASWTIRPKWRDRRPLILPLIKAILHGLMGKDGAYEG